MAEGGNIYSNGVCMKTFEELQEVVRRIPIKDLARKLDLDDWSPNSRGFNGPCFNSDKHDGDKSRKLQLVRSGNCFHCWGCGIGGDGIDLVRMVNKMDFPAALKWMVTRFHFDLANDFHRAHRKWNGKVSGYKSPYYMSSALYERVFALGRKLLFESEGREAFDFLKTEYGYSRNGCENTEWIYLPLEAKIKSHLHDELSGEVVSQAIDNLHLLGTHGDLFRLAIPWRDRFGRITGFFKLAATVDGVSGFNQAGEEFNNVKHDDTGDLIKDDPFNLHSCSDKSDILVVESVMNAAYLSTYDLGGIGVVATGGGAVTLKQADALQALQSKMTILAPNNTQDEQGIKDIITSGDLLRQVGLEVSVIPPSHYGLGIRDCEALVRSAGIDALKGLMEKTETWYDWRIRGMKADQLSDSDEDAKAFIRDGHKHFVAADPFEFRRSREGEQVASHADAAALHEPQEHRDGAAAINVPALVERLQIKRDRDKQRGAKDLLGYRLKRFKPIARQLNGVQAGFYVIAGVPQVGKTAFLTNLFLDLLEENKDLDGLFFSFDEDEDRIVNRLLALLCDGKIRIADLQKRVEGAQAKTLSAAYDRLIELAKGGRLQIVDLKQVETVEGVESLIRSNLRDGRKLFAVVDGLQVLEASQAYTGTKLISPEVALKLLADIHHIPVIASIEIHHRSGEAAKMPVLGDLAMTCHLAHHVWIAHPEDDYQNFVEREKPELEVTLSMAKTKFADSTGSIKLVLKRACNKITIRDEKKTADKETNLADGGQGER
jgi:DNA primase